MSDTEVVISDGEARVPWQRAWSRLCEVALGVLFLSSALIKAFDINQFIVQISKYRVEEFLAAVSPTIANLFASLMIKVFIALCLVAVEAFLGVTLLAGPKHRRLVLGVTFGFLAFLTLVVLYGWLVRDLDDCGCMGSLKMHPAVSLLKNMVMFVACWVAWAGRPPRRSAEGRPLLKRLASGFARLSILGAVAVATVAYAVQHVERVQPEIMGETPFAAFTFEANGRTWDLGKGEYFVALLSTTCIHCLHAVKPLNDLDHLDDVPEVVALCKGTEAQLERFRSRSEPVFPTVLVPLQTFYQLLGIGPPRYVLVRDGKSVKVWDGSIPSAREIREAVGNTEPGMALIN